MAVSKNLYEYNQKLEEARIEISMSSEFKNRVEEFKKDPMCGHGDAEFFVMEEMIEEKYPHLVDADFEDDGQPEWQQEWEDYGECYE